MSQLSFDEEPRYMPRTTKRQSSFVRLVLATGLVKTERSAEIVLVVLALAMLVLAAILYFFFTGPPTPKPLPPGASIVNTPGVPTRLMTPLTPSP